jgi:hypothetical protein
MHGSNARLARSLDEDARAHASDQLGDAPPWRNDPPTNAGEYFRIILESAILAARIAKIQHEQ